MPLFNQMFIGLWSLDNLHGVVGLSRFHPILSGQCVFFLCWLMLPHQTTLFFVAVWITIIKPLNHPYFDGLYMFIAPFYVVILRRWLTNGEVMGCVYISIHLGKL